jgi:hypothetical protein
MPSEQIRYYTKDTVLASWLYMNGVKLEKVTTENPSQVVFIGDREDINNLTEQFASGNPHGNIITFFRSYKDILSQIKDRPKDY